MAAPGATTKFTKAAGSPFSFVLCMILVPAVGMAEMQIPLWLSPHPRATNQTETSADGSAEVAYVSPTSPAMVIQFYEAQLRKSGIAFQSGFDGVGTTIRASQGRTSCVVHIADESDGARVKSSCVLISEKTASGIPQRPEQAPSVALAILTAQPIPSQTQSAARPNEPAGPRFVEYEIDGSVRFATVTCTNETGGREENILELPVKKTFVAMPGSLVYLSAQKTRITRDVSLKVTQRIEVVEDGEKGTVHVAIRVNGRLLQEATSSKPLGIATASGRVTE